MWPVCWISVASTWYDISEIWTWSHEHKQHMIGSIIWLLSTQDIQWNDLELIQLPYIISYHMTKNLWHYLIRHRKSYDLPLTFCWLSTFLYSSTFFSHYSAIYKQLHYYSHHYQSISQPKQQVTNHWIPSLFC